MQYMYTSCIDTCRLQFAGVQHVKAEFAHKLVASKVSCTMVWWPGSERRRNAGGWLIPAETETASPLAVSAIHEAAELALAAVWNRVFNFIPPGRCRDSAEELHP